MEEVCPQEPASPAEVQGTEKDKSLSSISPFPHLCFINRNTPHGAPSFREEDPVNQHTQADPGDVDAERTMVADPSSVTLSFRKHSSVLRTPHQGCSSRPPTTAYLLPTPREVLLGGLGPMTLL